MEQVKKNILALYLSSNGFMFTFALFLFMFEPPTGFLHYSPGLWLDVTLILFVIFFGLIFPAILPKVWTKKHKFSDEKKLDRLMIYEIALIVSSALTFGLALITLLYQTQPWTRAIAVVCTLYSLVITYPTQRRLERNYQLV